MCARHIGGVFLKAVSQSKNQEFCIPAQILRILSLGQKVGEILCMKRC